MTCYVHLRKRFFLHILYGPYFCPKSQYVSVIHHISHLFHITPTTTNALFLKCDHGSQNISQVAQVYLWQ